MPDSDVPDPNANTQCGTLGDDTSDEEDAEGSPEIEMASDTEEPTSQTQGSQSSPELFPATQASQPQHS